MPARKKRRSSRSQERLRLVALPVVIVALGVVIWFLARGQVRRPPAGAIDFSERVIALADLHGAATTDIVADEAIVKVDGVFVRSWRIGLPAEDAVAAMVADLRAEAAGWSGVATERPAAAGDAARLRIDLGVEAFDLCLRVTSPVVYATEPPPPVATRQPTATPRPSPRPEARGRLAILLDDGGQHMGMVRAAAALPVEVAVSVLPFLPYSGETAAELYRSGHEVWLHLPMEALNHGQRKPGPGAIMVTMSEGEIRTAVHAALNSVPHAVGVNNHMGSRATTELRVMTWVMQELKARGMVFIDSRTSVDTLAETAARAQGVAVNRRHVFLDNTATRKAVKKQLEEAVYRSRIEGEIIAIGHITNKVTLEVLEEELPGIGARGADLVPPSELVR